MDWYYDRVCFFVLGDSKWDRYTRERSDASDTVTGSRKNSTENTTQGTKK